MNKENVVCLCMCNIYIYINIIIYLINIYEYYSAIKEKEILPFMTTWIDLEGIIISEICQRKKNTYDLFILIYEL